MLRDSHLFTHSVQMFGFIEVQISQAYNYSQDNRLPVSYTHLTLPTIDDV